MKLISTFLTVCGLVAAQSAQAPNPVQQSADNTARMAAGALPVYRISLVERTTEAVNYNHRGGATKVDFEGTPLLEGARGEARVQSKQGNIAIEAEFRGLRPATAYGPEYLTYVMWAVTPEGRTTNLGEVLLNGTNSKLNVTTELQAFGLIVTAEPYFAVTQPSDVVVIENVIRPDTRGTIEQVDAKFELMKRGQYTLNVNPAEIRPVRLDRKTPLELYEARNAVQIARWTGAEQYAGETFRKAVENLKQAETDLTRDAGRKPVATAAREAVQMAEDARIITVKKIGDEQLANERQAGADREAAAQADAVRIARDADTARVAAHSEADRVERENMANLNAAQEETNRARRDSARQMAASQNEADRLKRENDAATAASRTEADRLKVENDARASAAETEANRLKAENDARAAAAETEANRLKVENDAQRATSKADLDRAAAEKTELRAQLLSQFNAVLQTRDTARGLIVNMSDVLFDTGKSTLRPSAREKLAKVAGIVSGHPGLRLDVEGHTDSVGGDAYNQQLSEDRGSSVRDYLTGQGMATGSVTSRGFGKTQPVASNDTAAGRQENRRVELVISGDVIGSQIGSPPRAAM